MQNTDRQFQNLRLLFGWYKHDIKTGHMSYDDFCALMGENNDEQRIQFLISVGLIAKSRVSIFCGGELRGKKDGHLWFLDLYPSC